VSMDGHDLNLRCLFDKSTCCRYASPHKLANSDYHGTSFKISDKPANAYKNGYKETGCYGCATVTHSAISGE